LGSLSVGVWMSGSGLGTRFFLCGCVILSFCWAGAPGAVGGATLWVSGSGPTLSLVLVVPTLVWGSVPAIFVPTPCLVPAVPTLLRGLVPAISGSGGSNPVSVPGSDSLMGPRFDCAFGSSGFVCTMGPNSVFISGPGGSDSGSALGSGGSVSVIVLGSGSISCSGGFDSVSGSGFDFVIRPDSDGLMSVMGPNSISISGSGGPDSVIGPGSDFVFGSGSSDSDCFSGSGSVEGHISGSIFDSGLGPLAIVDLIGSSACRRCTPISARVLGVLRASSPVSGGWICAAGPVSVGGIGSEFGFAASTF
jgi:hypothetical protein